MPMTQSFFLSSSLSLFLSSSLSLFFNQQFRFVVLFSRLVYKGAILMNFLDPKYNFYPTGPDSEFNFKYQTIKLKPKWKKKKWINKRHLNSDIVIVIITRMINFILCWPMVLKRIIKWCQSTVPHLSALMCQFYYLFLPFGCSFGLQTKACSCVMRIDTDFHM